MYTLEDCEKMWKKFDELKDNAGQHQFAAIVLWDIRLTPLYNDLHNNWNEHHAEVFIKGMKKMFKSFGIEIE